MNHIGGCRSLVVFTTSGLVILINANQLCQVPQLPPSSSIVGGAVFWIIQNTVFQSVLWMIHSTDFLSFVGPFSRILYHPRILFHATFPGSRTPSYIGIDSPPDSETVWDHPLQFFPWSLPNWSIVSILYPVVFSNADIS